MDTIAAETWWRADPDGVATAYREHGPRLLRFAQALCGDADQAREAVQEAFLVILRRPQLYDPARGTLAAFLYGLTRNRCRELRRETREVPLDDQEDFAESGVGLLEGLEQRERIAQVRDAILSLPPHYREVLVLVEIEGASYEFAAEALSLAVGTVRSRLSRARGLLEQKLRSREGENR